jgi:hypothetical protein
VWARQHTHHHCVLIHSSLVHSTCRGGGEGWFGGGVLERAST